MHPVLGFTGSSSLGERSTQDQLSENLRTLFKRIKPEGIVTGACVGVDSFVHHFFARSYPEVHRTVVFPGDLKAVDPTVEKDAHEVIWMPSSSGSRAYRARNEKLVELSSVFAAFWVGNERSGTFMTMNIATRAGKLPMENLFGYGLPDDRVRARYQDYLRFKKSKKSEKGDY